MILSHLLLLILVFYSNLSSANQAPLTGEAVQSCENILTSLQVVTPSSLRAETTLAPHRIFPWVRVIKEAVEPGQDLPPLAAEEIVARLEEMQMLLFHTRLQKPGLPSALQRRLVEALTRAASANLSAANIPHSVERYTSALGRKKWRIEITPQPGSEIPIVQVANDLAATGTSLQFDFGLVIAGKMSAGFVEGKRTASPLMDNRLSSISNSLFANHIADNSRMILPLRIAYSPQAIHSSVGVKHELRHWENSQRRLRRESFPFYGFAVFPLGIKEYFENEEEKSSLFVKTYGKFFSFEENDTITEDYFNLYKALDDPYAIFNRAGIL